MKVYIDFERQHKCFSNPIKIFKSTNIESIKQQLDEIEKLVHQGYYAVGYLAYECASAFTASNKTQSLDQQNTDLPLLLFGIFNNFTLTDVPNTNNFVPKPSDLNYDTSLEEYHKKIDYIRSQIELGNTYQTNYTIRINASFNENPIDYYFFLQKNNQANYCAYLEYNDNYILSISPELFFKIDNSTITTKPMKGTVARGLTTQQDQEQLKRLLSEKNLAENMMIVDLLRNDLSRISKSGSITVPKLFTTEKYPTLWQLTSTIEGQLQKDVSLYQIFQALFPCGSITGAPKTSTMQIISDIENSPRGVYCGTIGYIQPFMEKALFNIPIRTLTINNQQMSYGVGGGITWDSTSQDEYNEILTKAAILNRKLPIPEYIIESLLLEDGQFFLFDAHLTRLADSADYFSFVCDIQTIKLNLIELANSLPKLRYKIRISLPKDGKYNISLSAIIEPFKISELAFAPNCVNSNNVYLYHKTSIREHFPQLTEGKECINFNQNDEITEFVNGNIALFINHQWVTPKISSGLLSGTMRQFYLSHRQLLEKTITKADILKAEKIAFINSVRKWIDIDMQVLNRFKQQLQDSTKK